MMIGPSHGAQHADALAVVHTWVRSGELRDLEAVPRARSRACAQRLADLFWRNARHLLASQDGLFQEREFYGCVARLLPAFWGTAEAKGCLPRPCCIALHRSRERSLANRIKGGPFKASTDDAQAAGGHKRPTCVPPIAHAPRIDRASLARRLREMCYEVVQGVLTLPEFDARVACDPAPVSSVHTLLGIAIDCAMRRRAVRWSGPRGRANL
jgi:hypothetical protein